MLPLSRTDIRQKHRNHQAPLLTRQILAVTHGEGSCHVRGELHRDPLVVALEYVVHG
jgi:hypothetical protein